MLISKPEECSENYDRVADVCVRISPYKLTWEDAETKCQTEGSHLLHIMSEAVQKGLVALIKKKEAVKSFFALNTWSTEELEGYWTGGMVSVEIRCDTWTSSYFYLNHNLGHLGFQMLTSRRRRPDKILMTRQQW